MPDKFRYEVGPGSVCPKCSDNADPKLTFVAKTKTTPEQIRVSCGTCGWIAGTQPCADAPVTP